ncbi:hypothetical protein AA309_03090 [Microvirga vignae]|uniref:Uncharacterized protein n=1 Tax=Microvirga vignae TaxID=1225564 RepID=A0A0H1RH97_9HYPH|nr:hypothetical protein AA309_03090 [Microvirga vignae]
MDATLIDAEDQRADQVIAVCPYVVEPKWKAKAEAGSDSDQAAVVSNIGGQDGVQGLCYLGERRVLPSVWPRAVDPMFSHNPSRRSRKSNDPVG